MPGAGAEAAAEGAAAAAAAAGADSVEAQKVATQLIGNGVEIAKATQLRISRSQWVYLVMIAAMFALGLAAFVLALVTGFTSTTNTDTVSTSIFGGLSAGHVRDPLPVEAAEDMAAIGVQNAWLLSIVNTYWTNLAYVDGTTRSAVGLQSAVTNTAIAVGTPGSGPTVMTAPAVTDVEVVLDAAKPQAEH